MIFNNILRSSVLRNAGVLVAGNAAAQGINLLATPVLSRIFGPADFGWFYFFTAISTTIATVVCLRLELALVIPKKDDDAAGIFRFASRLAILTGLFSIGPVSIIYFVYEDFREFNYLVVAGICAVILIQGFQQLFVNWSIRLKKFGINSASRVLQALVFSGMAMLVGYFAEVNGTMLLLAYMLGMGVSVMLLVLTLKRTLPGHKVSTGREIFQEYRGFPLYNAPHALVGVFLDLGVIFFLNMIFNAEIMGAYAFAYRILKAPAGLVGTALFQVSFSRFSENFRHGRSMSKLADRILILLLLTGIPLTMLLMLWGKEIFELVFSEKWGLAGSIGSIMAPAIFLNFLASPLSSLPLVVQEQKKAFIFTLVHLAFKAAILIYASFTQNILFTFVLFSVAESAVMVAGIIWYRALARQIRN